MLDKMARKFRAKMFEQYLSSYLREQNVSAVILFADGEKNQAINVKHVTLVDGGLYLQYSAPCSVDSSVINGGLESGATVLCCHCKHGAGSLSAGTDSDDTGSSVVSC